MSDILEKEKAPAFALIVICVSNFGISLLAILSGLLRLTGLAAIGFFVGPIIANGAFQMMNGKRYVFAKPLRFWRLHL